MPFALRHKFDHRRRPEGAAARATISGRPVLTAPFGAPRLGAIFRRVAVALILLLPAPALAGDPTVGDPTLAEAGLTALGHGKVVSVIDGDTLRLEDGREVRLVGIQAPKLPLGRPGFHTWPLAEAAKAELERLALDRDLALYAGGRTLDRHGRTLAHLRRTDGLWIQGALVAAGLARVYSFPDNRAAVAELMTFERQARTARLGIWADPFYRVRNPDDLADAIDTFQIVEGRVTSAAKPGARLYLNFGADWKTDFTAAIDAQALKLFAASGIDPQALQGRRVRVRGWVKSFNGPLIDVTHPEQIEVLEE